MQGEGRYRALGQPLPRAGTRRLVAGRGRYVDDIKLNGMLHVAFVRSRNVRIRLLIDNRPLLLMVGTQMLEQNLKAARVTADEVREKLRTANVINYEQVLAVVMETTGDISVLHAPPDGPAFDYDLLQGVRDAHLAPALLEAQQRERRQAKDDAENVSPR